MANMRNFYFIIVFHNFATLIEKPAYLSMPKFLAGYHYNEEEISWHLEKNRILAGPNEWQQVCHRSNPERTGGSCEGADCSWLSSRVSRTLPAICILVNLETSQDLDRLELYVGAAPEAPV